MYFQNTLIAFVAAFALNANAQTESGTFFETSTLRGSATSRTNQPTATGDPTVIPTAGLAPCAVISSYQAASPSQATEVPMPAAAALECLKSVPLDSQRSSDLIDYIGPYLEFQSTLAYLKTPPEGYLVPGVDIFGGLTTIKENLQNNVYSTQFAFEKDLYYLLNVMPHEGHLSYVLPLFQVFAFGPSLALVSISEDGTSLPEVFISQDVLNGAANDYSPSPVATIDGKSAFDYLQNISMTTANSPQDPDAIYNTMFLSRPRASGGLFLNGAWAAGMDGEFTTIMLQNGTSIQVDNIAFSALDFATNDIASGSDLQIAIEIPSTNSLLVKKHERRDFTQEEHLERVEKRQSTSSAARGYPTNPIIIHSSGGYVAGYFMQGSEDTCVLSVRAFQSRLENADQISDNDEMQTLVNSFIQSCQQDSRTKLIIDLQGNPGGSVFNGFDLFKQLFPSVDPFGGTRFRATPAVNFLGQTFTTFGVYNTRFSTPYQIQANTDINGIDFESWSSMFGPDNIYADDFTSIVRYNLSDPISTFFGNGLWIYGYGRLSSYANTAQPFRAEDIVLLYDGVCASTCALFSEMMKAQAGVRSIVMGGRPTNAPMQAVGGTKGAQVQSFALLQQYVNVSTILNNPPSSITLPSLDPPPMYPQFGASSPGLNWRNNYASTDLNTPLQFVYEAANCRLFYRAQDIYNLTSLWQQVYSATWGDQSCVQGSTTMSDGRMPSNASETVPYDVSFLSNATAPTGPGAVGAATVNGGLQPTGTGSSPAAESSKSGAAELMSPTVGGLVIAVVAAVFIAFL